MAKGKKRIWILLASIFFLLMLTEIVLRKVWGFGDMVLSQADKDFEYIMAPNQNRFRFGNHIFYNEFSMRSLPLNKQDTMVVLGFGDSVINGGTLTDQDSIATTIVEEKIRTSCNNRFRFLNISAGSWGPDNCAAYLKKYGDFNAKMIVLFVSSHDAFDDMTFEKVVGIDEGFPDHQYPTAISELLVRYVYPKVKNYFPENHDMQRQTNSLMINKHGKVFNPGFEYFYQYTQQHHIPFLICLHAEQQEIEQHQFNEQGNQIVNYCNQHQIKLVTGFQIGESLDEYRDEIHLNEKGQKRWASVFVKEIEEMIKVCPAKP